MDDANGEPLLRRAVVETDLRPLDVRVVTDDPDAVAPVLELLAQHAVERVGVWVLNLGR